MEIQAIEKIELTGLRARTNNKDEMEPLTAKIGSLWNRFYEQVAPQLTQESNVYGVYTNYESDFTGCFDVVACADTLTMENLKNASKVSIQPGKYLTFSAQGDMPQTVIKLWGEAWNYFTSDNCPHTRTYTTDFEHYKSANEVKIAIAIQ